MIDAIMSEAMQSLIARGAGWTLFVLSLFVIWFLDKRNAQTLIDKEKESAACSKALSEQYEKRIEEHGQILDALTRCTASINDSNEASGERLKAINQLAIGFAEIVRDLQNMKERLGERNMEANKKADDIRARMETIQSSIDRIKY